ncbi:unnamed protein product [Closterium sp. NIES-54]
MDVEMTLWKSVGTYVDAVPPPGANILDGMWIFRVKRPLGSPPVFKARYVVRGFSYRQGVHFFQTFSLTLKMTTLRVLLHVATQRDYELHSLEFSTAFLQGSLHEEIWLRRPLGFTGSFPTGTQWSLRWPVYGLRQAPCEWHDIVRMTLAALGFAPSTADPSLFLRTDTSLLPFYILMYIDDLVFAIADIEALTLVDPPPLVEPLEVSLDTSGPAEGGDQTATDAVAPRRSARLAVPHGFSPRPSSPPLRPVAVDSGAAGGGDTGGVDSGGAGFGGTGGAGTGGAGAGSAGARQQETLSPEWLREWAVRWGSPGGGAGRAGAAGSGGAGLGGASAGVPEVGGIGTGGTGTTRGTGGAAAVGAAAGSPGSHLQEFLSPERLREWAVRWGSPGGGAGRAGAACSGGDGPGGAGAGVPRVGRARGTGTGGSGATGGTGGAGPIGASAVVPRVGGTGGADTGGATGGTGVGGASRQESLSPQ